MLSLPATASCCRRPRLVAASGAPSLYRLLQLLRRPERHDLLARLDLDRFAGRRIRGPARRALPTSRRPRPVILILGSTPSTARSSRLRRPAEPGTPSTPCFFADSSRRRPNLLKTDFGGEQAVASVTASLRVSGVGNTRWSIDFDSLALSQPDHNCRTACKDFSPIHRHFDLL